ncbi:MAG: single-stranded DNA-binding protein [Chitinophagaceae bacterium]|nr:single-stranded DNA-binding protein [Chitinophagaceae bacterium]
MEITARVTADAEVKQLKSGSKVVNFSVAVNDRFRTKDGEQKELTTFFNCSYWLNEGIAQYLTKGTLVEMSGRVSANAWTNTQGEAKATLNFHADKIKLHGSSKKNATVRESAPAEPVPAAAGDDLPF